MFRRYLVFTLLACAASLMFLGASFGAYLTGACYLRPALAMVAPAGCHAPASVMLRWR